MRKCHVRKCVEIHSNVFRFDLPFQLPERLAVLIYNELRAVLERVWLYAIGLLWPMPALGLRTMSIQKSSTINDDYLSILVRCGGQCQLEAAPCAFVMAINFWFLLELKQKPREYDESKKKREKETTIE